MKLLRFPALFVALAWAFGPVAHASTVLTFENLDSSPAAYDVVPTPYQGLIFTGWYFGVDTLYKPASGLIDLFTDYADPANPFDYVITNSNNRITSATPFIFDGAWFSGYSGVTFELWKGSSLVATSASLPDAPGVDPYDPVFLASGYAGEVDTVVVSGVQGYYAMDDFTFHRASTNAVPEPASAALAILGVGMAGWMRRRQS